MAAADRQASTFACRSLSQSSEVPATTGSAAVPIGRAAVAASAATAVYTVTAAMDVAALREDVTRLGTQVHVLEERVGRGGLEELESKVDNLGRSFAVLKEQMHTMVRERQLDLLRERKESEQRCESSTSISPDRNSSSVMVAMRRELDDFRARWMQLARQVDEQNRATSMCVSAIAELRSDSQPRETKGNSSASTSTVATDISKLRSELSLQLSEQLESAVSEAMQEARRDMDDLAKETASKSAKEAALKAANDAAKAAAKIAASETAREVAHIAASEAVEATAEKAREAAREVACAEMALRCDERSAASPGASIVMWKELRDMLSTAIATVQERQAALTSEMHLVQKDLRSELSAAVAAISKEVTTSCSDTSRAVACCQEELQGRYAELIAITNAHTSRYSKLRLQLDAMQQEDFPGRLSESAAVIAPVEQARFGVEAELNASSTVESIRQAGGTVQEMLAEIPKVASLEMELLSLNSKLQRVERQLWGDSPAAVEDSRVEDLESSHGRIKLRSDAPKAAVVEPALSTQKAAEELRAGLRSDLERLAASKSSANFNDEEWRSHMGSQFSTFASALGDEFDSVHSRRFAEMAHALGEEFATVFEENLAESEKVNKQLANEFRESYAQLFHVVRELERRQVELEGLQRSQTTSLDDERTSKVVNSTTSIENTQSEREQGVAIIDFDAEKFHQEHQSRLDTMAKFLGEEFEATHHVRMTDALDALGEEFDKVREPLETTMEELQKDQETLHRGLVSYVEEARQNHARLSALEQKVEEVLQRQTAHASELASVDKVAQSQQLAHLTHIAEYLGEEFDRAHSEKHQPIESCLLDLRDNQLWLAKAVKALQQQIVLPGGHGCSLEDLSRQLTKLSKVVQDMIDGQCPVAFAADPKVQLQVNSRNAASPKGRLQQSPGINSQESTSDSKRELHSKRSPDGTSDALSEMGSHLDNGGEWDRLHDKVVSLPLELEALRSENGASGNPVSGEVLARRSDPLEGSVAELRHGQDRLLTIVEDLLERQEHDKKFADFLEDFKPQNFDRLSSIVATLQERQSALASEMELLRERHCQPLDQAVAQTNPQKGAQLSKVAPSGATNGVRGELDKLLGSCDVTDMIVKMAGLPKELEAIKRDHNVKLREMAESLGEEFQHAAAALENFSLGVSSDMACALGEEFDKVYDENNQVLQNKIEAMRETQAKLVEIVLRQECHTTLAENTDGEKSNAQTQFESLCCFVRSEIALKVDALRQELAASMHQEMAQPCKAATEKAPDVVISLPERSENAMALRFPSVEHCEEPDTHAQRQSATEVQDIPVLNTNAQAREETSVASDFILPSQDTTLRAQDADLELADASGQSNHEPISPSGYFTLGVDQFESITRDLASESQTAEWSQREALRKIMDDELRRARMALESMPNFEGLALGRDQNSGEIARTRIKSVDVPEIIELGEPEETPLRERWPVLYVLPGLRAGMSEDSKDAQTGQLKQPSTSANAEKVVSRPSVAAASSSVGTAPAPSPATSDALVLSAPADTPASPPPKSAVEQAGPERSVGTIPEVVET